MKKFQKIFLILLVVLLILGIGGMFLNIWLNDQKNHKDKRQQPIGQSELDGRTVREAEDEERQLIGGKKDEHGCLVPAGYQWCPSTGKCQRMWEEYCEEYKEQFKGDTGEAAATDQAEGDAGESPPEYTADWEVFESNEGHFKFQHPDSYKTVIDKYGWPESVVHLMGKTGGESYDVTFEIWENEEEAAAKGRNPGAGEFFGMVENPFTDKFISITCWNPEAKSDCEDIYATLVMQQ